MGPLNPVISNQVEQFMKIYSELTNNPSTWVKFHHVDGKIEITHGRIHTNGMRERKIETIVIWPSGKVSRHGEV
jgi:hypothetical protein